MEFSRKILVLAGFAVPYSILKLEINPEAEYDRKESAPNAL
jgi:hypothetical protein